MYNIHVYLCMYTLHNVHNKHPNFEVILSIQSMSISCAADAMQRPAYAMNSGNAAGAVKARERQMETLVC